MGNSNWFGHSLKKNIESQFNEGKETALIEWRDANKYLNMTNALDQLNYQIVERENIPYGYRYKIVRKEK